MTTIYFYHRIQNSYFPKIFKIVSFSLILFLFFHQGILRQITVNDLPVGRSVDEVLRLVKAFQFVDKHGEGNIDEMLKKKNLLYPSPRWLVSHQLCFGFRCCSRDVITNNKIFLKF